MPYVIVLARVLFSRMPASLIKPDLQKGDMPTPRLPDNSDAFGSLISVKPNTSTVLWNAKLTETQIYRELSIEKESSLFN